MTIRFLACSALGVLLIGAGTTPTEAQAGPPCGPDLPTKCTPGKDAAILIGVIGAGALAFYLGYRMDHPKQGLAITGCTILDNGVMTLTDENTHTHYSVTPTPKRLRAGNRVLLRGKINQDSNGKSIFRVRKILEDDGPCETQSTEPQNPSNPG